MISSSLIFCDECHRLLANSGGKEAVISLDLPNEKDEPWAEVGQAEAEYNFCSLACAETFLAQFTQSK